MQSDTCLWCHSKNKTIFKKVMTISMAVYYLLTYSGSWALLEEPPIMQLLKFPAFYGIRRFNTVFTRVLHWSLSSAISIQFTPSYPISLRSILILSTHLRHEIVSGLLPSGFPTNILYALQFIVKYKQNWTWVKIIIIIITGVQRGKVSITLDQTQWG
jgi:hypothetical protein